MAARATSISSFWPASSWRSRAIRSLSICDCAAISPAISSRRLSSDAVIRRGAEAISVLASSARRSDSTVAGMLRETISVIVALIFADA